MKSLRIVHSGYFELAAIVLTAVLKFIIMDWLDMRAFYITATTLFWMWYVYSRYKNNRNILKFWGFKSQNFFRSWYILLPFVAFCILATILYAKNNNIVLANWHIIPIVLLYPLWGLLQQFIFLCIIALNLQHFRLFSHDRKRLFISVSFIFSLIHFPNVTLMIFTFFMELTFIITYWKWRNIWSIGIAHGWTATFLLFYVLNRDLWLELFSWF